MSLQTKTSSPHTTPRSRVEKPEDAARYLKQVSRLQEWLLLTGNFISRRDRRGVRDVAELVELGGRFLSPERLAGEPDPMPAPAGDCITRADLAALHRPEDFYRLAMNLPPGLSNLRENARAKHELAYVKQQQGRPGTAELLYRPGPRRPHVLLVLRIGSCHRARLALALRHLHCAPRSRRPALRKAGAYPRRLLLLDRAMAIQAFHGMKLQLGYSEITAARIAHTQGHHTECIDLAVSAANRMEECRNFRGWTEALGILFDSLAETAEAARMISLANLASEKIRAARPDADDHSREQRMFKFEKGRAHWIAGDVAEARDELEGLASDAAEEDKSAMDREIDRLLAFLRVAHAAPEPRPSPPKGPRPAKRAAVTAL